ncbi:ABC transporter substrate-binding protein [Paraburkholderia sp. Ac-20342]|uniref:ABC transporter substrate-binding protein n=1 Tax=Burkholderiaceae TaxID=119060 RepID=UPI001980336B
MKGIRMMGAALAMCFMLGPAAAVAAGLQTVHVGIADASSDVVFFIADKKGYFRAEGIDAKFIPFDSGAKMVAPLGSGQLEVAGGSPSAGLYNAVMRGIGIKVVADKGSTPSGYGYQPLLVRTDLVKSGRYKTLADLKGMKIAGSATGSASTSTMNEALKKAGLKPSDVERVYLGFPQHVMALENKAVDASLTTEPSATQAVRSGAAIRVMGDDQIYLNHQLAVLLYSDTFIHAHPDTARAFMRAYLRAARDYNDALKDGRIAGPNADEVISILTQYTSIKDASLYREIVPQGTNPDGKLNIASLENDLAYFKSHGDVKGNVTVAQVVDTSFAEAADTALGPYRPRAK